MHAGPRALASYLAKKKTSVAEFATVVGAHRSQIYRALRGERRPGRDLALAMEEKTHGAVPARLWVENHFADGETPNGPRVTRRPAA